MICTRRLWRLAAVFILLCRVAQGQTITVDAAHPTHPVSPLLFGVFFEEINLAGDGGLYAELVRNRSFNNINPNATSQTPAAYWTLMAQGSATGQMSVDNSNPLNVTGTAALKLTMLGGTGSVGAANGGYYGIPLKSGSTYNLSLYASGTTGFTGPLTVQLESANGATVYAQTSFNGLTTGWQKFTAQLTPTTSDTNAQLVVSIAQPGTVWLDVVSLFPQATFNNRPNGLRPDLAEMVQAMNPAFLRFPGGNFIEGTTLTTSERWKTTIGDISARPGHWNSAWSYLSTDGLGYLEYLEFCEDLGMEPLLDINSGQALSSNGGATNTVPLGSMGPWVQDAPDAVQFATGDTTTTWGFQRAADGHPGTFPQPIMEIGNETSGTYYNQRYPLFYAALTGSYPGIRMISPDWGGVEESVEPLDIVDQHYYLSAASFQADATMYDSYPRPSPQIFVGEYAVTSGYGTYGNLSAALGEAAFMTGLERNSDIVMMASYAPLFCNVNNANWKPDAIYYDNSRGFGTPSYYVQKLFGNNTGTQELPVTISNYPNAYSGGIGCATWSTEAEFANIQVTGSNGQTLYQSNFASTGATGWAFSAGNWAVSTTDSALQQTATDDPDMGTIGTSTGWTNYTLSLQARKISGAEGFLIMFYVTANNNWVWWNIGGWANTLDGIEQDVNGTKTTLSHVISPGTSFSPVQTGVWYNISIQVNGSNVNCYLNGTLTQSIALTPPNPIYASASSNPATNEIIIKAVNPNAVAYPATVSLSGLPSISSTAPLIVLTSSNGNAENNFTTPLNVAPVTSTLSTPSTQFAMNLPANSLTVLRAQAPVAQPQGVTVTSSNGMDVINWGPAAGASTYTVQRASSAGGPWTVIGNGIPGQTFTDTSVTPGAVYFYNVTAANVVGSSSASTNIVAMPLPPTPTIQKQGGNAMITVPSVSGVTYQLQKSSTLTGTGWTNVGGAMAGTGGNLQVTSTNGMLNGRGYYHFNLTLPSP